MHAQSLELNIVPRCHCIWHVLLVTIQCSPDCVPTYIIYATPSFNSPHKSQEELCIQSNQKVHNMPSLIILKTVMFLWIITPLKIYKVVKQFPQTIRNQVGVKFIMCTRNKGILQNQQSHRSNKKHFLTAISRINVFVFKNNSN